MTRISDAGLQQILLSGFQRASANGRLAEIQLASGKVGQFHSAVGIEAAPLVTSEGVVARAGASAKTANVALSRLVAQEAGLSALVAAAGELRGALTAALANGSGAALDVSISEAARAALAALNVEFGGTYVFGGAEGDARPAAADSLADLRALGVDAALGEAASHSLAIGEGETVDGGPTAREAGRALLDTIVALAEGGPYAGALNDGQRGLLVASIDALANATDDILTLQGLNGVAQARAADAALRHARARDLAEIVAGDIENADIAEALTRLSQDQLAIEASARALNVASGLSLLNFI